MDLIDRGSRVVFLPGCGRTRHSATSRRHRSDHRRITLRGEYFVEPAARKIGEAVRHRRQLGFLFT
jgi:hypothetical protein